MDDIIQLLNVFAPVISLRVWPTARLLLIGALSRPSAQTVASVLRTMGRAAEADYYDLPPGAQPGGVVGPVRQPDSEKAVDRDVRARKQAGGVGGRRYAGAARGSADSGRGVLPR